MVRGLEAIEEAAMLLRRIRFSGGRPAYAEGEWVTVSVDPRWSDDSETMRVLITCHGLALQRADWKGLRINIERKEGDRSVAWLAFLNARGQAVRDALPPGGEYSLSLPSRVKSQVVGPVFSSQPKQIRKRGGIQWNYDRDETDPNSIHTEEPALVCEEIIHEGKTGTSLAWRVIETAEGEVQISFEDKEEMAGQRLAVTLIETTSGKVQYSGVLTLFPGTTLDKCEGRLSLGRSTGVQRPCDLVFEKLPPADDEMM